MAKTPNIEIQRQPMKAASDRRFFEDRFSDALRVVMYGSEDGDNFIGEVEDLARLLAEYDNVEYDPVRNRLSLMVKMLKVTAPNTYKTITEINNE